MPGEPAHHNADEPKSKIKADQYVAELVGQNYSALSIRLPETVNAEGARTVMEKHCRDTVEVLKGTLTSLKAVQAEGLEGREALIDYIRPSDQRQSIGRVRVFMTGPLIYVLSYYGEQGTADRDEVQRFLDSFKRTGPGEATAARDAKLRMDRPSGTPVAAKWQPFTPPGKEFTISMPGEPRHIERDLAAAAKFHDYGVDLGDRIYMASCSDLAKDAATADRSQLLETMAANWAAVSMGTVAESKAIKFDGLNGREIFIDYADPDGGVPGVGRARVFIVGDKTYLLFYRGPKGTADRNEVQKFFSSARIVKPPPPAKAKPRS